MKYSNPFILSILISRHVSSQRVIGNAECRDICHKYKDEKIDVSNICQAAQNLQPKPAVEKSCKRGRLLGFEHACMSSCTRKPNAARGIEAGNSYNSCKSEWNKPRPNYQLSWCRRGYDFMYREVQKDVYEIIEALFPNSAEEGIEDIKQNESRDEFRSSDSVMSEPNDKIIESEGIGAQPGLEVVEDFESEDVIDNQGELNMGGFSGENMKRDTIGKENNAYNVAPEEEENEDLPPVGQIIHDTQEVVNIDQNQSDDSKVKIQYVETVQTDFTNQNVDLQINEVSTKASISPSDESESFVASSNDPNENEMDSKIHLQEPEREKIAFSNQKILGKINNDSTSNEKIEFVKLPLDTKVSESGHLNSMRESNSSKPTIMDGKSVLSSTEL